MVDKLLVLVGVADHRRHGLRRVDRTLLDVVVVAGEGHESHIEQAELRPVVRAVLGPDVRPGGAGHGQQQACGHQNENDVQAPSPSPQDVPLRGFPADSLTFPV